MLKALPEPPRLARISQDFIAAKWMLFLLFGCIFMAILSIGTIVMLSSVRFARFGETVTAKVTEQNLGASELRHIEYRFMADGEEYGRHLALKPGEYAACCANGTVLVTYDSSDPERQKIGKYGWSDTILLLVRWLLGLAAGVGAIVFWLVKANRHAEGQRLMIESWPSRQAEVISTTPHPSLKKHRLVTLIFPRDGEQITTMIAVRDDEPRLPKYVNVLLDPDDPNHIEIIDRLCWAETYWATHRRTIRYGGLGPS